MKELERAIRLGLEADSIDTIYTVTQNESLEMIGGGTTQEKEVIRYRSTVRSQISAATIKPSGRYPGEDENTYDICANTQKKVDSLKPEQVYWIKDELDKW